MTRKRKTKARLPKGKTLKAVTKRKKTAKGRKPKKPKMLAFWVAIRSSRFNARKFTGEIITHYDKMMALTMAAAKHPGKWVSLTAV